MNNVIPPILLRLLKKIKCLAFPKRYHAFIGDFPNWPSATAKANGYDAEEILERVKCAALKAKSGEVAFERDGIAFTKAEYRYPVATGLLLAAQNGRGNFNILDVGGSLGSTYFQHRRLLPQKSVHWHVVEQPNYVAAGRTDFEDEVLRFHESVEQLPKEGSIDAVLFSSVLQYLENPYRLLAECLERDPTYVIIDRTPCCDPPARIVIQCVGAQIVAASYPCHLFSIDELQDALTGYNTLCQWTNDDHIPWDHGKVQFCGMIFERRPR